uniref:Uncharacterized protein n=1 Tax=Peronospora matthiolae TaxID=2874970 RepID=A0AAV1VP29_9STRA
MRPSDIKMCIKDHDTLRSALPDVGEAQATTFDDGGPGRVSGMLPDRVQPGLLQSIGSPDPQMPYQGTPTRDMTPPTLPLAGQDYVDAQDPVTAVS